MGERARPRQTDDRLGPSKSVSGKRKQLARSMDTSIDRSMRRHQSINQSVESIDRFPASLRLLAPAHVPFLHARRTTRPSLLHRSPPRPHIFPIRDGVGGAAGPAGHAHFWLHRQPLGSIDSIIQNRPDGRLHSPKHSLCLTRSPHTTTHTTFHSGTKAGSWARRTRACRPPVQQQRGGGRRAVAACVRKDGGRRDGGLAAQARADGHG